MTRRLIMALTAPILFGMGVFGQTEYEFTYATGEPATWGTTKLENYDAAVRLADPTLVGSSVTGVTVRIPASEGLSGFRIWLSSALLLDGKQNAPDILSCEAIPEDGTLSLRLSEPVTVPEEGLYVGYSFNVDELTPETKSPVAVTPSASPDAFFIHTSRTYRSWAPLNKELALGLTVTLRGDFTENAVALRSLSEPGVLHGNPTDAIATVRNHGKEPVSSLLYSLTLDGTTEERSVTFDPPLAPDYDSDASFSISLPSFAEAGSYPWSIEILKVNGEENMDSDRTLDSFYYVYPYLPDHHPLMEEFTATWCGWCPKGMTALEDMEALMPDRFIGVSYHRDDVMAISEEMPVDDAVAPSASLDRGATMDPYFGTYPRVDNSWREGILRNWEETASEVAVAGLSVEADWADEEKSVIRAKSRASFIRPFTDADFRFLYILAADGLKGPGDNPDWFQKNYYSGMEEYAEGGLREWYEAPRNVTDIEYDAIAVLVPDMFGVEGSLPADIPYLEELTHEQELRLSDAVNLAGENLVQDPGKLFLIAAVVDARTNRIVNARKTRIGKESGVGETTSASPVITVEYHDLQGRPVAAGATSGTPLLLRTETHADGTRRTTLLRP